MAGNWVCKSQHRNSPQAHEGEKSIPLFMFFILSFEKILFVENLLRICYLSGHSARPREIPMYAEIDTNKHMLFSCMQLSTLGLCVLTYRLIRGLLLLLAEWEMETGWKAPETKGHNHVGICGSSPPAWLPVTLAFPYWHLMSPPTLSGTEEEQIAHWE